MNYYLDLHLHSQPDCQIYPQYITVQMQRRTMIDATPQIQLHCRNAAPTPIFQ
jgi:hypothetical protein